MRVRAGSRIQAPLVPACPLNCGFSRGVQHTWRRCAHAAAFPRSPERHVAPYLDRPAVQRRDDAVCRHPQHQQPLELQQREHRAGRRAVIYNGKVEYGVFRRHGAGRHHRRGVIRHGRRSGDQSQPPHRRGRLGCDLSGLQRSHVSPVESHAAAISLGQSLAWRFIRNN